MVESAPGGPFGRGGGEYSVERDGTGSGELNLTNDAVEPVGETGDQCPALNARLFEEPMSISFDFAIRRNGFDFVGLSLTDAEGEPIAAFGSQGFARPQD
jgi:hypothetical protein